ncbi:MAG TPA: hypothetical protein VFF43_09760, partial [Caldimonas sp.]|nr:hypothetical protein [Caldimonas sp.]
MSGGDGADGDGEALDLPKELVKRVPKLAWTSIGGDSISPPRRPPRLAFVAGAPHPGPGGFALG